MIRKDSEQYGWWRWLPDGSWNRVTNTSDPHDHSDALIQSGWGWPPGPSGARSCSPHGVCVNGHAEASRNSFACSKPFLHNFTACTWNAQGLFCTQPGRGKEKLKKIWSLVEQFDVVFIQKAHCGEFKEDFCTRCIGHSHTCFWSPHINAASGGVGFIISKSFQSLFQSISPLEEIVPGRIAA